MYPMIFFAFKNILLALWYLFNQIVIKRHCESRLLKLAFPIVLRNGRRQGLCLYSCCETYFVFLLFHIL